MRIWQCVDGHPVCEKCRVKLDSKGCPSCNRSVEGRNIALGEKIKKKGKKERFKFPPFRKDGKISLWGQMSLYIYFI